MSLVCAGGLMGVLNTTKTNDFYSTYVMKDGVKLLAGFVIIHMWNSVKKMKINIVLKFIIKYIWWFRSCKYNFMLD